MSVPSDSADQDAEPPFAWIQQDDGDRNFLANLAKLRGYTLRRVDGHWLEWDDGQTPLPDDPDIVKELHSFELPEPFVFPHLTAFGHGPTLNVPIPSFLPNRSTGAHTALHLMHVLPAAHVRDLAGRLSRDDDGRAHPDALGWLIAYRDALALDLRRCADRLRSSPRGFGTHGNPMDGARDTLKVWFAELVAAQGGLRVPGQFGSIIAGAVAWGDFTRGTFWGDDVRLVSSPIMTQLAIPELPRAVAVATVIGLRHYARICGQIVAPAYDIWPRLLAAETVLHAALAGTPLDEAWLEEATRRQQEEDARRDRESEQTREKEAADNVLRRTLLDDRTRLSYIMATYHPEALANPETRSVWADTHTRFVEAWRELGLPEPHPYPDPKALKDADSIARRRKTSV